jgi:hypothetical protein
MNGVNKWRAIVAGVLIIGQAWAGRAEPSKPSAEGEAPAMGGQAESGKAGPGFTGEERRRIQELRQWLAQRHQQRKPGTGGAARGLPPVSPVREARALDLTAPDLSSQNAPFRSGATRGSPVLHIGRGPDGRIHHRYVFSDSGPDRVQSLAPGAAPSRRVR